VESLNLAEFMLLIAKQEKGKNGGVYLQAW